MIADNTGKNIRLGIQDFLTETPIGGLIARDIAVAGAVDVTINATADATLTPGVLGGTVDGATAGGIGITFANSDTNMRIGDLGVFVEPLNELGLAGQQLSSFGGIELIGLNIDNLEMVIRGNDL